MIKKLHGAPPPSPQPCSCTMMWPYTYGPTHTDTLNLKPACVAVCSNKVYLQSTVCIRR